MNEQDKQFLKAFVEKSKHYQKSTLEEFMLKNIFVKSSNGNKPYNFDGYAFLKEIVRKSANHKDVVFLKAAQIGYSTFSLTRLIWKLVGTSYKAGIYFPSDTDMKDFKETRVDPLIEQSPFLKEIVNKATVSNTRNLQFGNASLAFRGSWTKRAVKTIDLDIVMLDEVDEHDIENLEFISDRMLAYDLSWMMSGSQPSMPDSGIHRIFLNSDQHYWLIKCQKCNEWNDLISRYIADQESIWIIENHNDKLKAYYKCVKCGAKLNNQKGEYVPKTKHERRGYQISQLFVGDTSTYINKPTLIYKKYKDATTAEKRKNFTISYIGLPYSSDEEQPLNAETIKKCEGGQGLYEMSSTYTFHGADQGDTVHGVFAEPTLDGKLRIVGLMKCHILNEDYYKQKLSDFNVFAGVIDAMPNRNWSMKMALIYRDILKIQFFTKKYSTKEENIIGDESIEVINVNRDESLQDTVDAIKNELFIFPDPSKLSPADLALYEEFKFHLTQLIRERGEDENGKPLWQFKKKVANHYGMALNSLRLAYNDNKFSTSDIMPVF